MLLMYLYLCTRIWSCSPFVQGWANPILYKWVYLKYFNTRYSRGNEWLLCCGFQYEVFFWSILGRRTSYTIGSQTCDPESLDTFCNGKLKFRGEFCIKLRAYTNDHYIDSPCARTDELTLTSRCSSYWNRWCTYCIMFLSWQSDL